ncbi:electron transport complex subunit RsxC [Granulosicoccus antarcticus]|uniref:Ion-translocating oxidoreductase complex subunit C n=1 Tax=Granulosicoccus antarcticus IMCC3135 TaxID=1192854 RepID=A0A2Z2NTI1_9GAMM|nr:electron transport complex subunit RsxC [Granulosicoccus antarcticus]ASJ70424.1 Electron transport complex subunit RsxC [Granulosicoccus antarcticus IMCC3135]
MALAETGMNVLRRWWPALSDSQLPELHGGLALPRNKPGLPLDGKISTLPLPAQLVLPLLNYRREALTPLVSVGQQIQRGQMLAEGLIASASGCIVAIEPRAILHPSARHELCIVIQPDTDTADHSATHPIQNLLSIERLAQCGIRGLGGAGFATSEKFASAQVASGPLEILLINAVECEPLISCDEALMMCEAPAIIEAISALMSMTRCRRSVLAIENDKLAAISALQEALAAQPNSIELQLLPPIYPSGAERSLIQRITGQQLAAGERAAHRGILSINVATALAAHKAQAGVPLTSRIVTIAGEACPVPVNVRVTFGTTVADVLRMSGNQAVLDTCQSRGPDRYRVRVGGPLSGFDLMSLDAPVSATTNCISVHTLQADSTVQPCIRCGACSEVCPEQLLPQQLYWYARADHQEGAQRFGLDSCIECGCCDVVCPSAIALTATFRHAKDARREQQRQDAAAMAAEQRYLAREQRLAQRAAVREERRLAAKSKLAVSADPIADALNRARQRRKPRVDKAMNTGGDTGPDGQS